MSLKSAYEKLLKMAGDDYIIAEEYYWTINSQWLARVIWIKNTKWKQWKHQHRNCRFWLCNRKRKRKSKRRFYSARDDAANRRAEVASLKRAAEAILSEPNPEKFSQVWQNNNVSLGRMAERRRNKNKSFGNLRN